MEKKTWVVRFTSNLEETLNDLALSGYEIYSIDRRGVYESVYDVVAYKLHE